MKLIKMKCESCGATLKVKENIDKIHCEYCGAEILIDDDATELQRVEEVKLKARKENHEQSMRERQELHEQKLKQRKELEESNSTLNFKKSKFSKILLVFFAISILFFFTGNGALVKALTVIQALLFIGSWLMGMKIVKEPMKGMHIILAIVAFVLIIPIVRTGGGTSQKAEKIVWDNITMHEILPEPLGKKGKILSDTDTDLSIYIYNQTKEDYTKYVESCKEKGFIIDSENETNSYDAFNNEGYKLRIYYNNSSKEYHVDLESPIQMKENAWSDSTLANMLPKPKSTKGKVESDSKNYYIYYAGDTSLDDFNDYVNKLKKENFNLDYSKTEKSYSATNKSGYKVSVSYEGFNTIRISITAPDDEISSNTNTNKPTNTNSNKPSNSNSSSNSGIRKDFKKAMDDYEKFIDEYITFMKKYEKSDGTDAQLLKDYTKYLEKYTKMMESFEKWESKDLNDKETKYYLEVETRVSKKLIEASLE